ncbi:MAG TPA: DUF4870 domain-containing protein [Mycobacteriales bacterium]|nr:DUF4870 domain-containing protein [Mycobacteriales bacterium]
MSAPETYQGIPWRTGPGDTRWAVAAHLLGLVGSFVPALVILLIRGRRSGLVRQHGFEALNFQLTVLIGYVVTVLLIVIVIGLVLTFALWITNVILVVTAALAAGRGEAFRYRFSLRLFR